MKKEAKLLRCALLNGSSWITERKYMRRYKVRRLLGIGAQIEEGGSGGYSSTSEAKEGLRFAAAAARITDERASSEDRKHTLGGVFVAIDNNLGADAGAEERKIESIPGNGGRIAQTWVNVRGGLRIFSVYFSGTRKDGRRGMKPCWKQF